MAQKVIAQVGAQSLKDKGKVMSLLMPQVRGRAEGSQVSEAVTHLLSPK
ncbi:MAG: GatB/YqeY domain-containing protein [Chloroflexota bacterium]